MTERGPLPADGNGNSPYYVSFSYTDLEGQAHDVVTHALSWETAQLMLDEIPGAFLCREEVEITKNGFGMTWD